MATATAPARGDVLRRVGDLMVARKEEIADLMTREMGKPLKETRGDVQEGIDTAYYAATHGRELFGRRCTQCHTVAASKSYAQVGPDLDTLRPPRELVLDAIQKGRAQGNWQMAAGLYEGEDAEDVAAYVAKAVGQTGQGQ